MDGSLPSFTPEQFQELAKGAYPSIINLASAGTLLMWDFLLTFSDEVKLIWKSKFSMIKIVFLVLRYLALAVQCVSIAILFSDSSLSRSTCKGYVWFRALSSTAVTCASQVLLIYRVLALHSWNSLLQLLLGGLFLATNIPIIVFLIIGASSYSIFSDTDGVLNRILGNCLTLSYPKALSILWIPELIFQSILFILIVSKFTLGHFQLWKTGKQIHVSQIYLVFLRDGVWVYVIQLVVLLLCVIYNQHTSFLGIDFIVWQDTITSICCTRLILNLRSLGSVNIQRRDPELTGYTTTDDGSIELNFGRTHITANASSVETLT